MIKLHGYWRSGAAWRLRIAFNLKGVAYETVPVHLVRDGGEHRTPAYRALNPQGRVPTVVLEDGTALIQSPAILEWIEETWPTPPLLPWNPILRAKIRGVAAIIGCDTHPLMNAAGVLPYLRRNLDADETQISQWVSYWNTEGFGAVEALVAASPGPFCFGDQVTLADLYLIPQLAAARRFKVDLAPFPRLLAIEAACAELPAFASADQQRQPDAE